MTAPNNPIDFLLVIPKRLAELPNDAARLHWLGTIKSKWSLKLRLAEARQKAGRTDIKALPLQHLRAIILKLEDERARIRSKMGLSQGA
jgi:hypothetical protein